MKSFSDLAQANVDHYNEHPTAHNLITVALAVGGVVLAVKLAKRMAKEDPTLKSGRYAK